MSTHSLLKKLGNALMLFAFTANVQGATTDLTTVPLVSTSTVLPNLMFILDDSGSMAWAFMPDKGPTDDYDPYFSGKYGFASSQCNGVYYNPRITYNPPVSSTGAALNATPTSFSSAYKNGYNTGAGTVNLGTSFVDYNDDNSTNKSGFASQAAFYYKYTGTQTAAIDKNYYNTSSTFYKECNSSIESTPGNGVFTKVTVSATSGDEANDMPADERQNFANWYSYYRTRMKMMKTASGIAFSALNSNYRVAYMTINNNVNPSFLNFAAFDATQKSNWYSKLYGATPDNSTPLRVALSNAGRIYAKKLTSLYGVTITDPVQYSCQQNFTLLSTDGFWNGNAGYKEDGTTAVGNQDGPDPDGRPYIDGATANTTVTTTYTRNSYSASRTGCSSGRERLKTQPQIQKCTVVTTDGVAGAESCSSWSNNGSPTYSGACANSVTLPSPNPSTRVKSGSTVTTTGFTGGTSDTLADVAEYYYVTDLRTTALGNCTSGSSANTLCAAPDAKGNDLTYNNVPASGLDKATWQHMTTFTLGLGARGSMAYTSPNYMGDSSGDFYSVRMGLTADSTASPPICSWQANGSICNWPTPVSDTKTAIDDLWHAAVNGRGTYFSATDPAELQEGLDDALGQIGGKIKSAAAVAVSNQSMDTGDNFMFGSAFNTSEWSGDLKRWHISLSTGLIDAALDSSGYPIPDWSAQDKLDVKTSRTIYTYDPGNTYNGGGTNMLKSFIYTNLTDAEQAYFNATYLAAPTGSGLTGLSQFLGTTSTIISLTAAGKTAAAGTNLVNYLRGVRTYEGAGNDNTKYYRQRTHLLGDIVNAEAVYVKAPQFRYADAGYGAFKSAHTTRQPMIYAAANDGMLHAFYAYGGDGADGNDPVQYMYTATGLKAAGPGAGIVQVTGGDEAWAYIPTMVLPNLFTLADKNYANKHQFFVDGSPATGDICTPIAPATTCTASDWKTILVGGLNRGGKGYYALDITNPAAPKALWEFNTTNAAPYGDANLGYTYGKPVITKLKNGTWVVLVTSGYNNVASGQDGKGYLYVINANTGERIRAIGTGVGDNTTPTPSGLAQISAMVSGKSAKDNVVMQVYGGDLLGNLWRFDVNGDVGAAGFDAQLLATLKGPNNNVQTITTSPEIGLVDSNTVVFVGTGRYLGISDVADTGQKSPNLQSMYAIKDPLATNTTPATAVYSNVRTSGIQQTLGSATCANADICTVGKTVRTGSNKAVNFASNSGWYVDLPDSGERVNTNPALAFGTLAFIGNVPPENTSDCSKNEGYSWEYFFDYRSGAPIATSDSPTNAIVGKRHSGLGSTPTIYQLPDGTVRVAVALSNGQIDNSKFIRRSTSGPTTRRTSWRELINDQ